MVLLVVLSATLFSALYVTAVIREAAAAHFNLFPLMLLVFKTLVEVGASYYGFTLLFIAVHWTQIHVVGGAKLIQRSVTSALWFDEFMEERG
jgi:hypothetical protein